MMFFTSDTHLFHTLMAKMRGFQNVEEMNEKLIDNWNASIHRHDTVYHLGDFAFNNPDLKKTRYRLNGKIHLISGNHDKKNNQLYNGTLFSSHSDLMTLMVNKQPIVLCHYQMKIWDRSHFGAWHLFGHSHTGLNTPRLHSGEGKSFDVGVDNWGLYPVSYDQVVAEMARRPDNFNIIQRGEK